MHTSRELRSSSFEITVGRREVRLVDLFDGFGEHDRLGLVIRRPCGGVGASFLFHVGRPLGDHAEQVLEVINDRAITRLVVEDGEPGKPAFEPEALASARARIATCLVYSASGRVRDADVRIRSNPVSEGYVDAVLDPQARRANLRGSNGGDRSRADAIAAGVGEVTPEERRRIKRARKDLVEDGVPVETYRRSGLDEALGLLVGGEDHGHGLPEQGA